MVTYEDVIKMLEETKAELLKTIKYAEDDRREWYKDRDMEYVSGSTDVEMIVEDFFDAKIGGAKERLAECNTVTTMSAGVSLLDTIVAHSKAGHVTEIKVTSEDNVTTLEVTN